jgi:hypothetical protein
MSENTAKATRTKRHSDDEANGKTSSTGKLKRSVEKDAYVEKRFDICVCLPTFLHCCRQEKDVGRSPRRRRKRGSVRLGLIFECLV